MYRFFLAAAAGSSTPRLALTGASHLLGSWNVQKALLLQPMEDLDNGMANWTVAVNLTSTGYRYVEYRYILLHEDGRVDWEPMRFNRNLLVVPHTDYALNDGAFGLPPAAASLRGPPLPAPKGRRVAICGSSVAFGSGAAEDRGWAQRLAEALAERHGHQTINVAVPGYDTQRMRADFQRLVAPLKPDMVVIGLSLANEGLAWQAARLWRVVARNFQNGMRALLDLVSSINATAVLGDVYPHDAYRARLQRKLLKDTHRMLLNTSAPLLNWLGALDDGEGRWQRHHMQDAGHPNTLGHQVMFEAINLSIFDPL